MDIHSIHDIAVLCTVDSVNRRLWLWWMAAISTDSGGDQAENSYISRYTGWVGRWMDVQGPWWYHSTIVMPIIRFLHTQWSYEILLFCFWNNMYKKIIKLMKNFDAEHERTCLAAKMLGIKRPISMDHIRQGYDGSNCACTGNGDETKKINTIIWYLSILIINRI